MEFDCSSRRDFLLRMGGVAAASLIQTQWPAIAAAAQHAHQAVKSGSSQSFAVLTPEQAKEVEAISACIIPTDEQPGAREAGVVYFIDVALKTFASDSKPVYDKGIPEVNALTTKLYPGLTLFSAASAEQQEKILTAYTADQEHTRGRFRRSPDGADFFQTISFHTKFGFLVDPEGGGNRDYVGWKVINRDPAHSFSPPFGFYDKDYPGWHPTSGDTDKK
jgi:gluconate 2-dehydrogenase gamma chain